MPLDFSFLARSPYLTPPINPNDPENEERWNRIAQGARPLPMQKPKIALPPGAPPLTNTVSAPSLPDVTPTGPARLPMSAPPLAMPAGAAPRMRAEPLNDYRGNQIGDMEDFRRDQYVRRSGTTDESGKFKVKRTLGNTLQNALIGGLQGLSTGGGLGAALGGAAAGGLGATISPMRGRENIFRTTQAPMILAEQQKQREQQTLERQEAMDELRKRQIEAGITQTEAQTQKILTPPLARPERQRTPRWAQVAGPDGNPIYVDLNDPQNTNRTPYRAPAATREPSTSEQLRRINTEETAREGTPEQIATSSTNARRPEAIASAPEAFRSILQTGKRADGKTPTAKEIQQAEAWLNKRMNQIYQENLRYTRGVREQNKARRATGQKPAATGSRPTAQRKARVGADFINQVAKTLNISPAEARRRIEADGYEVR